MTPLPSRISRFNAKVDVGESRSMKPPMNGTTKRSAAVGSSVRTPGTAARASSFASSGTSAACFIPVNHFVRPTE
eukprot:CAMPEP_0181258032 /NCGR_PEP_ID=MMETSP1096-20121128/50566_1 /TAXON_ID=156174 ORGANISM="Chrysochromulina ericina, Strain CCMP281" /NCGR_SAMPLE_ID=MMETSP1096 /ASSEMBLY_ACC=CAM_ASM_000453 /LENGTH=74 /DNA_ID=CAMNT_0023356399 /DNA_START=1779 /DNA_END=2003 /DNA_ORIENTATION=-